MTDRRLFILSHPTARNNAMHAVAHAPDGSVVTIGPAKRTDGQNERYHAIVGDIAKSGLEWMGKRRTPAQWKVLTVSGHSIATGEGAEIVPGLEGEFVNLRESTALMSIKRGSSLIEYTTAFALNNGVLLRDPRIAVPERILEECPA